MNESENIEEIKDMGGEFNLRIQGAANDAVLRIQQEEIIQELRTLSNEVQAMRYLIEHNTVLIERQVAATEIGLRTVSLVPVTITFLLVISWFFWKDKLSETWFVGMMFFLALPHLHEFIEKGMRIVPFFGDVLMRRNNGNHKKEK